MPSLWDSEHLVHYFSTDMSSLWDLEVVGKVPEGRHIGRKRYL